MDVAAATAEPGQGRVVVRQPVVAEEAILFFAEGGMSRIRWEPRLQAVVASRTSNLA